MSECVYFIRACYRTKFHKSDIGFVRWKIGRTFNVARRLRTFQTASPVPLEVFGTLACESRARAADIEAKLHAHFEDSRLMGEWFAFNYQQSKAIWALVQAWPVRQTLAQFFDSLPRHIDCEIDVPKIEVVPLPALHAARMQVKRWREKMLMAKEVVDTLTAENAKLIRATTGRRLFASTSPPASGNAPVNTTQV